MKKTVLITIFLCLTVAMVAQTKTKRHIYLWDVTKSMEGKGWVDEAQTKRPDNIWEDVKNALCRYIDNVKNENDEILVLPFQEKILLKEITPDFIRADFDGKEFIKRKIKEYKSPAHKYTNIYDPLSQVVDKYLKNDENTIVYLLTDGIQDDPNAAQKAWKAIEKWNLKAGENNYLFYVCLTDVAKDPAIIGAINDAKKNSETPDNVDVVPDGKGGDIDFLVLAPPQNLPFNLIDNRHKQVKSLTVTFVPNNTATSYNPIKVNVKLAEENPFFSINQTVNLQNNNITFEIKFKDQYKNYDGLSLALDTITSYKLLLDVVNKDDIKENEKIAVSISPSTTTLELINKYEKTLKIKQQRNTWNRIKYYSDFLGNKYTNVILKDSVELDFNVHAQTIKRDMEFELVKKNEKGEFVAANEITLYKNDDICPENILKVKTSESKIALGFECKENFLKNKKEKELQLYLRVKEKSGLDRIDDKELSSSDILIPYWIVKKNNGWNPLATLLFWILVIVIVSLTLCFIYSHIIKPMNNVKFSKLFIDYNDGAGEQKIEMGRAYKLLCTNKKTKFSIFSKFFTGVVKVEVNDFWSYPLTIKSGMRNNIRLLGLGSYQLESEETVRREPFTIANENGQKVTITTT